MPERNCDMCDTPLELVDPRAPTRRWNDVPLWKDALVVSFLGGYGMFFDGGPVKRYFCKDCAENVMENFPIKVVL